MNKQTILRSAAAFGEALRDAPSDILCSPFESGDSNLLLTIRKIVIGGTPGRSRLLDQPPP